MVWMVNNVYSYDLSRFGNYLKGFPLQSSVLSDSCPSVTVILCEATITSLSLERLLSHFFSSPLPFYPDFFFLVTVVTVRVFFLSQNLPSSRRAASSNTGTGVFIPTKLLTCRELLQDTCSLLSGTII